MAKLPSIDYRASLKPKPGGLKTILGENTKDNIMHSLYKTGGVLFPYTPSVTHGATADYDEYSMTHSNYKQFSFTSSSPSEIAITADFTAQSDEEAKYLLAVMTFFRSVTKSYYGLETAKDGSGRSGLPPPVLNFNYLGENMFRNVPVILNNFSFTLPSDVDYVPVQTTLGPGTENVNTKISYVPTKLTFSLVLLIQMNPLHTKNKFNLDKFKQGKNLGGFV